MKMLWGTKFLIKWGFCTLTFYTKRSAIINHVSVINYYTFMVAKSKKLFLKILIQINLKSKK